jgi:hypothetical protein
MGSIVSVITGPSCQASQLGVSGPVTPFAGHSPKLRQTAELATRGHSAGSTGVAEGASIRRLSARSRPLDLPMFGRHAPRARPRDEAHHQRVFAVEPGTPALLSEQAPGLRMQLRGVRCTQAL